MSKYQSPDNDAPYPNNRGQLISPPNSGGSSNGIMNGAFPPGPRSAGGPSPPPSVGRSSNGTNMYARSESGRSQTDERTEAVLGEHYLALKSFLNGRDGKQSQPPNRARDKLLRLSGVQFLELSTDVYDELIRRQATTRGGNGLKGGAPPFLLPEQNFHPKRNQARQKLSSLGPPRFRDLATDVFCELERRFPRFAAGDIPRMGSPVSVRQVPSRSQTPVNNGFPPRSQSRSRRPSNASSIRGGAGPDPYAVPRSPGLPNAEYNRPTAKQFQSNTIVPNKSTMLEEDDDAVQSSDDRDAFGLERVGSNRGNERSQASERSAAASEVGRLVPPRRTTLTVKVQNDKKLIDDYQLQIRELREKMEDMEDQVRKKDNEMNSILDGERSRATAANLEKKEWADMRLKLESQVADAQDLNDSLKQELDRMRDEHNNEARMLRDQIEDLRQSSSSMSSANADRELQRENEELRISLQEQQQITEQVRRETQELMRDMKMLSQQSGSTWEKQAEMEGTIESLEREVRDWRNRYARTKTQLRNLRASSLGLTIDQDVGRYIREKGFTEDGGLVKDVHVTKFQISIDELLQRARVENPEKVIDAMKSVVVSVRRITKDIDESTPNDDGVMQQQAKLKAKVSSAANNLITASKNFAASAGISPVSLLDAAASHLVAAIVDLLRTVKIRATPAGELDDDDDGTITPVDSTGFFSPRSNGQSVQSSQPTTQNSSQSSISRPPPFQGLGGNRVSADSSAYSPISSPRESIEQYPASRRPLSRGNNTNGLPNGVMGYLGVNKNLPPAPNGLPGGRPGRDNRAAEDLKLYLEDQSAIMVQSIQSLVGSIRSDAAIDQITGQINEIAGVVGTVVSETESAGYSELIGRLASCRDRLLDASSRGKDIAAKGRGALDREWRMWTQTLPPIAFEIARETKELIQRVDRLVLSGGRDDDFS
jgi:Spa2 homology domain (SHD) of GIT